MNPDLASVGIAANPHGAVEQRVPCPHCEKGSRDRALGINVETGAFHCFRCGWKGRAGAETGAPVQPIKRFDDPAVAERKRERLRRVWGETVPLSHAKAYAVRRYLEARALGEILSDPPAGLRAHPGVAYWDGSTELGLYPAMVALFHSAEDVALTLHCTFLRQDGCAKAAVPSPRKILGVPVRGATKGGAIKLYGPRNGILGIAEGIESALSLRLLKKIPVWASFCADNLARAHLPSGLRELHIALDVDESGKGEQVSRALAARVKRWSPRTRVTLWHPDIQGPGDLNDELLRRGAR